MGRRGNVNYQNPWAARTTRRSADPVAAEFAPLNEGGTGPGGGVGWRPFPTLGPPPLQIGVFGDVLLNQFPAYYNQPQLHQGVEGLNSRLQTPDPGNVLNEWRTTKLNNVVGGQRWGQRFTGPLGPISSRKLMARVKAAQVRQSGLQATEFGQTLTGG